MQRAYMATTTGIIIRNDMAAVSIKTIGLKGLGARMNARQKKLKNLRPTYRKAGILIQRWIDLNFRREGGMHDKASLKWVPLKASTVAGRRKGTGVGRPRILQDTGRLKADWQMIVTTRSITYRSQKSYSRAHEDGTSRIPQRKILPEEKQAAKIVFPVFREHVKTSIK